MIAPETNRTTAKGQLRLPRVLGSKGHLRRRSSVDARVDDSYLLDGDLVDDPC
jgi:hypothetical protein